MDPSNPARVPTVLPLNKVIQASRHILPIPVSHHRSHPTDSLLKASMVLLKVNMVVVLLSRANMARLLREWECMALHLSRLDLVNSR